MTAASDALPPGLLRCPQCLSGPLDPAATASGELRCGECSSVFPRLASIPWLLPEPHARLAQWRQRWHFMLRELEQDAQSARDALARRDLPASTRARLELRVAALERQPELLSELLAPLRLEDSMARHETHLALRTQLPLSQDLHSYYANLHRDWVWGEAENDATAAFACELLGGAAPRMLLIPGSGAGRLAYDLHRRLRPQGSVACDINPLLLFVAAAVLRGQGAQLYEFPLAARSIADGAVLRQLPALRDAPPGLHLVFADVARLPFRPAAFDTVLTPWLVDILPQPFSVLAATINATLPPGGRWINLGSLAFAHADPALRHAPEEVLELLVAQGFEIERTLEREVPYMRAPGSRHSRLELLWGFAALKRRDVDAPADAALPLPEWLVDARLPVPALPYFRSQSLATRVYAFVTALIDGKRGMGDIAAHLVEQRLMRPEEAVPAVRSFLIQLYEESRSARNL